jgi:hypothetical protein
VWKVGSLGESVLRTYLVLSLLVGAGRRFGTVDIHHSLELGDKLMKLLWSKIQETTILVIRWHLIKDDNLFRQVPFDKSSDCFLSKFNFETTGRWFIVIWYRRVVTIVVPVTVPTTGRSLFTYFTTFIIDHFADRHQRTENSADNFSHFIHHDIK